jgi:hypothetical protein
MSALYFAYRLSKERGARKLRLARYAVIASSIDEAIERVKVDHHGDVTLPEEVKVLWFAEPTDYVSVSLTFGFVAEAEISPELRAAWAAL